MKILLLDNYDSFTFNLLHLVEKLSDCQVDVKRNDEIELDEFEAYDRIILSPGPGLPKDAGIMPAFLKTFYKRKNILGVCLGHQAIAESFGAQLNNLSNVYHGVATPVLVQDAAQLFQSIPIKFMVGRYHSWIVDSSSLPNELSILASDELGNCMAIKHKHFPVFGVQFHPESILTEYGEQLMKNWLSLNF